MKTLYAIICLALTYLPAHSQIRLLDPRTVLLDTTTYHHIRRYIEHQDSVVVAGQVVITGLKQQVVVLSQQVENRNAEVERQRMVNGQQGADNAELTKKLNKALALPLRPPFYADTRAIGIAALTFLVGLLIAKH